MICLATLSEYSSWCSYIPALRLMLLLMAGTRHSACISHFWDVLWCSFFPGTESTTCCGCYRQNDCNSPTWQWGIIKVISWRCEPCQSSCALRSNCISLTTQLSRADGRDGSVELIWRSVPANLGWLWRSKWSERIWHYLFNQKEPRAGEDTLVPQQTPHIWRSNKCGRQKPSTETGLIPSMSTSCLLQLQHCFIVLCEAATYLSMTSKLNTNWENWMVRWWIEAWRAGCSRSQGPNRTWLCPSVGPSGVMRREGPLTEDVRGPKIKIMHQRNLEDNT